MLDTKYIATISSRIDQKTKPVGALGQLEDVATQLALIQSQGKKDAVTHIDVSKPTLLIFAGDHGIADAGVSIAPSAVTHQMVVNFLNGGAAINCCCLVNDIELKVVDAGILLPIDKDDERFISQRLGSRTNNFALEAAMSVSTVEQGINLGKKIAKKTISTGSNLLMFGEMGIGNTSSAAAIYSALSGREAELCVGYGTGITDEQLENKVKLVSQGVERCKGETPINVLSEVGGFEIVQIVGAILGAVEENTPVLIDGFIVSSAAYVATKINPDCRDFFIFAHQSHETGHKILLEDMNAQPLLDLSLRLGEGTGAALAMPLLKVAAEFYNNMASFESAGVTV